MSLAACAEIVRRGDPDRFLSALAAPRAAREKLFPIYAFNVEVARAPWVTQEPLIAEMRLQWWRDALGEIASGGPVRAHEVTTPLAAAISPGTAAMLVAVVDARRWDVGREGFADADALVAHLAASAGTLMEAAAGALGACDAGLARDLGTAGGIAAWLRAVPQLAAAGRRPLPEGSDGRDVAAAGLNLLDRARRRRAGAAPAAVPALWAAWEAGAVLTRASREPHRIAEGTLQSSEFRRRFSLLALMLTGRY